MEILVKSFYQLSIEELYEILLLRSEVFVVEQNCVYQDIDGKDNRALHIIGIEDNKLVGYARCFPAGLYFKEAAIGRVIIREAYRSKRLGHVILNASVEAVKKYYDADGIRLSAQLHLTSFYEAHGFKPVGADYLEDGIPHINMIQR